MLFNNKIWIVGQNFICFIAAAYSLAKWHCAVLLQWCVWRMRNAFQMIGEHRLGKSEAGWLWNLLKSRTEVYWLLKCAFCAFLMRIRRLSEASWRKRHLSRMSWHASVTDSTRQHHLPWLVHTLLDSIVCSSGLWSFDLYCVRCCGDAASYSTGSREKAVNVPSVYRTIDSTSTHPCTHTSVASRPSHSGNAYIRRCTENRVDLILVDVLWETFS